MPGRRREYDGFHIITEEEALVKGPVEKKEKFMLRVALCQAPGYFISVPAQAFQRAWQQKTRIDGDLHGLKISGFTKRSIIFFAGYSKVTNFTL